MRRFIPCQTLAIAAMATFLLVARAERTQAGLLTSASEAQLEAWLGGGDRVFTNIFTKTTGDTAADFHAAADGKGPTISLMQITSVEGSTSDPDVGQIIGGYNPQSWSSNGEWLFTWSDADRNAFIFNLSTGVKQDQRLGSSNGSSWGAYQTLNTIYSGPTFGSGHDIIVHEQLSYGSVSQYSYGTGTGGASDGTRGQNLLGDSYTSHRLGASSDRTDVTYGQLEVYTFSDVQSSSSMVPEPTSLAVFGAIGFAGCLRRRRVK